MNIHFRDIGHDPEDHSVTYENGQARERTQVLMDLANKTWGMVIGTGDMSELALGWATYNGDHMSMYGVNASVPKTLVRHLVKYVADDTEDEQLREVLYDATADSVQARKYLPPKTETSHRRQKIWWNRMNCMTSSYILCFALDMSLQRSIVLPAVLLRGNTTGKRS